MPYAKAKVYSDGSHYIAIPHTVQKKRLKKGVKVKVPTAALEDLEEERTPFDGGVQMSLFDTEKSKNPLPVPEKAEITDAGGQKNTVTCAETEAVLPFVSRKEAFERLYRQHSSEPGRKRKQSVFEGLRPYFKTDEETKLFVELNFRRKQKNLITRRIRMTKKANLQEFNYFVTVTCFYGYC